MMILQLFRRVSRAKMSSFCQLIVKAKFGLRFYRGKLWFYELIFILRKHLQTDFCCVSEDLGKHRKVSRDYYKVFQLFMT